MDGYTVDDRLVRALAGFPTPTNKTDIRSFCGLTQQFEAFSPNLARLLSPLRELLSSKVDFVWTSAQQEAFENVRKELTHPRMLATFDRDSRLRLETDAAQSRGLGMALWQEQADGEWQDRKSVV